MSAHASLRARLLPPRVTYAYYAIIFGEVYRSIIARRESSSWRGCRLAAFHDGLSEEA